VAPQRPDERYGGVVVFGIDVEACVWELLEQLLEGRDGVDAVDPCSGHLGPRERGDRAGVVGHTVELVVVERHEGSVGSQVDVGLEVVEPEFPGTPERSDRVFRCDLGPATVGDRNRSSAVEECHGGCVVVPAVGDDLD